MKTPREILLNRHRSAAPKLDAIRREVMKVAADVNRRKQPVRELTFAAALANAIRLSFLELIWPCRRIWTGLAAVWILIFIFNFSQRDPSELMARKTPPPSPEMILTFRQQEKLLAELMGPNEPQAAAPPKPFLPQPRSEGSMGIFLMT
jgi:hypothetical protein